MNPKSEAGQQIFLELVKTSDALIENFRPGVMDRLGLGFEVCKATKDPIVYCAISGFGQQGPLKDNPAYDQIIQGMSGVMDITGSPPGNRKTVLLQGFSLKRPHQRGGVHKLIILLRDFPKEIFQ